MIMLNVIMTQSIINEQVPGIYRLRIYRLLMNEKILIDYRLQKDSYKSLDL